MKELYLNIYDETGKNIERTAKGEYHELLLGVVIDIFKIFDVDDEIPNIWEMSLKTLTCYKELRKILHTQFPDITHDEWRRVRTSDLLKVCSDILKFSVEEFKLIPEKK